MKEKASPIVIGAIVVILVVFLVVMYRRSFPPMPRADIDNPKGMPMYAQKWMEQKKKGQQAGGASTYPGSTTGKPQNAAGNDH